MNRIDRIFAEKKEGILSIYLTAGYPGPGDTLPAIRELEKAGADMVEIGMPFSDPLADGPVLQGCNQSALENGMTLNRLFAQLEDVRSHVDIPLILMGYVNPVLSFGMEAFCRKARDCGMDGVILPDLPLHEYELRYKAMFESSGLHMIFLITPQTSRERICRIASAGRGFIYMVSAASTTGMKKGFRKEQIAYFRRIQNMKLELPLMIGFGISSADTFREACAHANGAIIGSAFMKHLTQEGNLPDRISSFIRSIRNSPPSQVDPL